MATYSWSAALALLCLAILLAWCGWLMWSNRRARRNERQVESELMLSRGLLSAKRSGLLVRAREDLQ